MLVLTRKVGESIAIGDDVKIIVMQIKGKQVRLGIKASPTTVVHREEVYQRIQEENQKASLSVPGQLDQAQEIFGKQPAVRPEGAPLRRHVRPARNGSNGGSSDGSDGG